MIDGSCLCGGVRFEIARAVGPFEFCHCSRCRKASGSAFAAMVGVRARDFRLVQGRDLVASYEAPLRNAPPPYRAVFCRRCGSPVPDPDSAADWFEVPAGVLDADPAVRPDTHIFVEHKAPWYEIADSLPQLDEAGVRARRASRRRRPGADGR
jgi:hypothetical protein